jgi:transcriptional regulator with XRE-family HTH domain
MKKTKTYMDKLMENKEFRQRFDEEYQNLCIGEQVARIRHQAHLIQAALAKRTHTTKSAISHYESVDYKSYSLPLLNRIAKACGAVLKIDFVPKGTKKLTSLFFLTKRIRIYWSTFDL